MGVQSGQKLQCFIEIILGDPAAASRDDAIFSGESFLQARTYSYRTSSRNVQIHPAENYRGEFQKNDATKPRKSQTVTWVFVSHYFSSIVERLLKLSTMCKFPLHGPCNNAVGTWGRSPNYSAEPKSLTISIALGVNSAKTSKKPQKEASLCFLWPF